MAKRNKGKRKRNNNKVVQETSSFDMDLSSKMIVATVILVIFALFYLLTVYITNNHKEKTDDTTTESSIINYSSIVVGRSFDLKDEDYIVVYYDNTDEELSSKYSSLISSYKNGDHYPIYSVNMGDPINKTKSSKTSNPGATNIDELAIAGDTLIHFSNGSIIEYVEGFDNINSYLS